MWIVGGHCLCNMSNKKQNFEYCLCQIVPVSIASSMSQIGILLLPSFTSNGFYIFEH